MGSPTPAPPRQRGRVHEAIKTLGGLLTGIGTVGGFGLGVLIFYLGHQTGSDGKSAPTPSVTASPRINVQIESPADGASVPRCIPVRGTGHALPGHSLWIGIQVPGKQSYLDKPVSMMDSDHWSADGIAVGAINAVGVSRVLVVVDVEGPMDKWLRSLTINNKLGWYAQIIGPDFAPGIHVVQKRKVLRDSSTGGPDCSIPPG